MTTTNISPTKANEIEMLPARKQFMVFTLFGDYLLALNDWVWTSDLVYLMGLMDMKEKAVRATLSRMTKKGWLATEKQGRRSRYKLSPRGTDLLQRGQKRIFERIPKSWDGQWTMVVYSLPENLRSARHVLRTQLGWLGFGSFSPGVWISVHDRREELSKTITSLAIESYVELFSSAHFGPSTPKQLVERCWDLSKINTQYAKFIEDNQENYQVCLADNCTALTSEEAFIKRFWLTHTFQSFPTNDPNLPDTHLPEGWKGSIARQLFDDYHILLGKRANQFVSEVLSKSTN